MKSTSDRVLRQVVTHLLRKSDPRLGLKWGFHLSATQHYQDSGYGHLVVVTPTETVGFSRLMLEATRGRLLLWQGVARCRLSLPDMVSEMGLWHMLPAVDVSVTASIDGNPLSVVAQIPWELVAQDHPVPVLTTGPVPGWPR